LRGRGVDGGEAAVRRTDPRGGLFRERRRGGGCGKDEQGEDADRDHGTVSTVIGRAMIHAATFVVNAAMSAGGELLYRSPTVEQLKQRLRIRSDCLRHP
jgi:hypothetical protein